MIDREVVGWKELPANELIGADGREVAEALTPFDAKYTGEEGLSIGGGVPYQLGGRTIATTFRNATQAVTGSPSEVGDTSIVVGACVVSNGGSHEIVLNIVSRENVTDDVVASAKKGAFAPDIKGCDEGGKVPFPILETAAR